MNESSLQRVELLLGKESLERIMNQKIILFGVGGVGGWCAESLIRSGIQQLTIVDFDTVNITNINRQLPANIHTIGRYKVEVLKEHFTKINPDAEITIHKEAYTAENSDFFRLNEYDFILDAIDSLPNKVHLIQTACQTNATFFSSMGAALRIDPTKVRSAEFWKIEGDPLARALRNRFRQEGKPSKKFTCLYSEEHPYAPTKGEPNGSLMPVTAAFGLAMSSLVIQYCLKEKL